MKCKSDDGLEILEKPGKNKQIFLNSFFGCSFTSNNAKNNRKTKKTTSSAPKLVKCKTAEENWIPNSLHPLIAPFDVKIWLQYDKDGEYATNLCCKVCIHNLESTLKECSILKKIGWPDQPITPHPMQLIMQKVSHIKKPWNIIGKTHAEKRDHNQQSIKSGLARINVTLTHKKIETAYFIAKEELTLTKFERILALEKPHNVELDNPYCNNNMCGEIIDYMADDLAMKVLQKLKSSNFHSALWDGATDIHLLSHPTVSEKETIFLWYLDKVGSDWEVLVKTEFLGLAEVNHAHTEGIKQSIYESFEQIGM